MKVSVVMIALNEEKRIGKALDSVQWADERVVIDGGSIDATKEVAKSKKASVMNRPFKDFSSQKNYAIECAKNDWVLVLDADEICDEDLKNIILQKTEDGNISGFYIRRRNFFLGRELRYGGQAPDHQMRFFLKNKAKFENIVHERLVLSGKCGYLSSGFLIHHTKDSITGYFERFQQYTDLEALLLSRKGDPITVWTCLWKPFARFMYFYILKGGIMDGFQGWIYHTLSYFYYLVKLLKAREIMAAKA